MLCNMHFSFTLNFILSFSIPPDLIPGRMSLLFTTLLILINTSGNAREKTPTSDSFSLIDLWLGICMFFAALAIFEYAIVIRVKYHWKLTPGRTEQTTKVNLLTRSIEQK